MLEPAALPLERPDLDLVHRLTTAAVAIVAILALAPWHPGGWSFGVGMSGLLLLAHWVSYRRRGQRDRRLVAFLALAMLGALLGSLQLFWGGALDSPAAVANVFVSLGVIQSFYLPRRKDVEDALVAPILTIVAAAAYSRDLSLAPYLLAFGACLLLALALNHIQERRQAAASLIPARGRPDWLGGLLPTAVLVLGLSALAFLILPRNLELWRQRYPTSSPQPRQQDLGGALFNPAYPNIGNPSAPEGGTLTPDPFNPEGYYGLSTRLDLNYRGRLSPEIVMQVRSAESAYWRGLVFDRYTGQAWEMGDQATRPLPLRDGFVSIPPALDSGAALGSFVKLTQSFYLLRPGPNAIFAAYQPVELYFPTSPLYYDRYGSLRAPEPLAEGTVYTAISYRQRWAPEELRATPMLYPRHIEGRYLGLPALPQRVVELAQRITAPYGNPYDKAMAVYDYLVGSFAYDLEVPSQPPGQDTVDWFLFEERAGYCEHFATAMAVLLRAAGIPTRLVTGYAPGTYNPFSGYYEVRGRDAHAWTDVFFYGYGWVAFDPTPGEPATERAGQRRHFILGDVAPYLNLGLGLGPWMAALGNGLALLAPWAAGAVVLLLAALLGFRWGRTRTVRQARRAARAEPRAQVLAIYEESCRALSRRGLARHPASTPAEFLAQVSQKGPLPPLEALTRLRYQAAYSLSPIGLQELTQARQQLALLEEHLRLWRSGRR